MFPGWALGTHGSKTVQCFLCAKCYNITSWLKSAQIAEITDLLLSVKSEVEFWMGGKVRCDLHQCVHHSLLYFCWRHVLGIFWMCVCLCVFCAVANASVFCVGVVHYHVSTRSGWHNAGGSTRELSAHASLWGADFTLDEVPCDWERVLSRQIKSLHTQDGLAYWSVWGGVKCGVRGVAVLQEWGWEGIPVQCH